MLFFGHSPDLLRKIAARARLLLSRPRYARLASMAANSSGAAPTLGTSTISEALQAHLDGRLSLDEYLDAQVQRAVAHLRERVPGERLQMIKEVLREQVVQSPGFRELLTRAGVQLPAPATT